MRSKRSNPNIKVLCVARLSLNGKKDVEIINKLPHVDAVISADYHFRMGTWSENKKYLDSLPESHIKFYKHYNTDPNHFINKTCDQLVDDYLSQVDTVYVPGARFDPSSEHCIDKPKKKAYDIRREQFELRLFQKAKEKGIPVLAVCAGSWRLANANGGKTIDLSDIDAKKHDKRENIRSLTDKVVVKKGTMLHGIHTAAQKNKDIEKQGNEIKKELIPTPGKYKHINESEFNVNSAHWRVTVPPEYQPGTEFGRSFETSAVDAETNTVEAFESKHGAPTMGVQFHPEYAIPFFKHQDNSIEIIQDYKTHKNIIDTWIEAGQTYHNKKAVMEEIKNLYKNSSHNEQRLKAPKARL